jgi:hypothetical protein
MTDVAWDLCILGIGVTGGIFSAPEMVKGWGPEGSLLAAVIVIAVNLVAGIGIQVLRKTLERVDWLAIVAWCSGSSP